MCPWMMLSPLISTQLITQLLMSLYDAVAGQLNVIGC